MGVRRGLNPTYVVGGPRRKRSVWNGKPSCLSGLRAASSRTRGITTGRVVGTDLDPAVVATADARTRARWTCLVAAACWQLWFARPLLGDVRLLAFTGFAGEPA